MCSLGFCPPMFLYPDCLLRCIKFDGLQGRDPKTYKISSPPHLQPSKDKFVRQAEHSITNSKTGKVTVRTGYFTEEEMKTTLSYPEYLTLITLFYAHGSRVERCQKKSTIFRFGTLMGGSNEATYQGSQSLLPQDA